MLLCSFENTHPRVGCRQWLAGAMVNKATKTSLALQPHPPIADSTIHNSLGSLDFSVAAKLQASSANLKGAGAGTTAASTNFEGAVVM